MGSGCDSTKRQQFRCTETVSDQCVIYTGEAIPWLSICPQDRISEVEEAIINKLAELADGTGIKLSSLTSGCDFITTTLANADGNLAKLIQGIFDNQCTLRSLIQTIQDGLEPPFAFDVKCLTLPENPSRNQIIQANINKTCELDTKVTNITSQLATIIENSDDDTDIITALTEIVGNEILAKITSCQNNIVKTGTGTTAQLQFIGQTPIGGLCFGEFPISGFDNSGLGLASAGYCGWAICNGNNGTKDRRGFTLAMATNLPGPALDPIVSPGTDIDLTTNMGSKKGKSKYKLVSNQLPDHKHIVADPGHVHDYTNYPTKSIIGKGGSSATNNADAVVLNTGLSYTGITVGGVEGGSGQPIDVRQPTQYVNIIQRIK